MVFWKQTWAILVLLLSSFYLSLVSLVSDLFMPKFRWSVCKTGGVLDLRRSRWSGVQVVWIGKAGFGFEWLLAEILIRGLTMLAEIVFLSVQGPMLELFSDERWWRLIGSIHCPRRLFSKLFSKLLLFVCFEGSLGLFMHLRICFLQILLSFLELL